MRYYPDADPYCFVEIPPAWQRYCREPNKSWKPCKMQKPHIINHYRDLEGAKMEEVRKANLYFPGWSKRRIRSEACLPLYYGVGNRFIRLEKAPPVGFKCAPMPISLVEARSIRQYEEEQKKKNFDESSAKANETKGKNTKMKK